MWLALSMISLYIYCTLFIYNMSNVLLYDNYRVYIINSKTKSWRLIKTLSNFNYLDKLVQDIHRDIYDVSSLYYSI